MPYLLLYAAKHPPLGDIFIGLYARNDFLTH